MLNLLEPSDGKTIRRLKVGDPPLLAKNVQRREAAAEYKVRQTTTVMIDSRDNPDSDAPGKGKHIGDCKLCGAANVPLLDGHIIPKWAYRRARGVALPDLAPDPVLISGGVARLRIPVIVNAPFGAS